MKKILAIAIASAFAAPAMAATSNVDIYGQLHGSVNFYSDEPTGVSNMSATSNASRIGFKGSEDLGGGLKGIWQIETGVNMDEGGGFGSGRNTFVGLSGGFGTALLGKHDTPLKLVGRKVDLFGDTQGDSRNVMGGGSDTRADNVIAYLSPNFSGFSGAFAYSTDFVGGVTSAGEADDGTVYNLSAAYENGPIYVGFGYGDGDGHEAVGLGSHWRLAGSFSFGDFKVVGQYDSLEDDATAGPVANTLLGDYDAWMIGGAFKMGAMTFKANYMAGEEDSNAAGAADPEQFSIGVDYALSKRTTVYGMYVDGEDVTLGSGGGSSDRVCGAAGCAPSAGLGAFADSGDISAFSVGVIHKF
jgi:predicted porin